MTLPESFARISELHPDELSTWEEKIYLTFDVDWAHDDVLADTIDLVEKAGVAATWFVTHATPLLERLRANPKFEVGIHPNFNFLLAGDSRNGTTAENVVDRMLTIVPEAKSIRSHSVVQGSGILRICGERGLKHEVNHFVPEQAAIILKPWSIYGITKVAYFWADDWVLMSESNTPIHELKQRNGLRVFGFHPIHVFLNTEDLSRYERARPHFQNPSELLKLRYKDGRGTRTILKELFGQT